MKLNQQVILQEKKKPPSQRLSVGVFPTMPQNALPQSSRGVGQLGAPDRSRSFQVAHNVLVSFKYAWAGLSYAFSTQRNFRIHLVIGTLALSLSSFLHLSAVKMAVIGLTIGLVLAMELLNTAIEAVVDLTVGRTYDQLAKVAKDCAAGAVFVVSLVALLVASFLLLPPLLTLFQATTF